MLRRLLLSSVVLSLLGLAGCAPPCDRYCNVTTAYIERCLTEGTQEQWRTAAGDDPDNPSWAAFGFESGEAYEDDCKTNFDDQLANANDRAVLEQACEDEANEYDLLESRGQCSELP